MCGPCRQQLGPVLVQAVTESGLYAARLRTAQADVPFCRARIEGDWVCLFVGEGDFVRDPWDKGLWVPLSEIVALGAHDTDWWED